MAKKKFGREKYQEKILNSLNSFLRKDVGDPRFQFVSITKVELNQDYSQVKAFWDTFDLSKKEDIEKNIETIAKKARNHLAKVLDVRHVPQIEFLFDAQYVEEQNIMNILNAEKDDQEK